MIVIADTSPINYLVLIEQIGVLPKLYGRILVPPSVCEELKRVRAPEVVRRWIADPPGWLEIAAPQEAPDSELIKADLDLGERDAILLAQELSADELIIDDMEGRREAHRRRLHFIGTVGVLQTGAERGLLNLREALTRLQSTSFYIAPKLLERIMRGEETP